MFSKMSISQRFTLTFILLILLPILLLNLIVSYFQFERVQEDYITSNRLSFSSIPNSLNEDLKFAFNFADIVYSDYDINLFLNTDFKDSKDFNNKYSNLNLNKLFEFYSAQSPNIFDPELYSDNPTIFGETLNIKRISDTTLQQAWYIDFMSSGESVYLHIDPETKFASVIRLLNLNQSSRNLNLIRVPVDLAYILDEIKATNIPTTAFLLGEQSLPLYTWNVGYSTKNPSSYYALLTSDAKDEDLAVVFSDNIDYYGNIRFVFVIPSPYLFDKNTIVIMILSLACTLIGSLIFMRTMKQNYIQKIDDLVLSIDVNDLINPKDEESDSDKVIAENESKKSLKGAGSELLMVKDTIQNMSKQIHELIKEGYVLEMQKNQAEIRRKQSELNSLLSQINPHYLFNVLNAIRLKCLIKGEKETAKILLYVSKIFRQSITWNEEVIPLQEEMTFIKEYLAIEKYRFEDKLTYDIILPEELNACEIPKMTLQPFVENACVHGVESVINQGNITIEVKEQDEEHFMFAITNPVTEFPTHIKEQIFGYANGNFDVDTKSVGLKNTFARLRHYYENFSFDIIESEGQVTFILILPKHATKKREENDYV